MNQHNNTNVALYVGHKNVTETEKELVIYVKGVYCI